MGMYFQRGGQAKVTSGLRPTWHSAPSVSPALRAPPLPTGAERHAVLSRPALLVCLGFKSLQARGPQADVALRSFRVPRPSASSFTYRNGAPRRPESASTVGARRCSEIAGQRLLSKKATRWARLGYSAIVRRLCWLPGAVGWMFPVGKGGARLSGRGTRTETSTPLSPAYTKLCVQMNPLPTAYKRPGAPMNPVGPLRSQTRANKLSNSLKAAT